MAKEPAKDQRQLDREAELANQKAVRDAIAKAQKDLLPKLGGKS